MHPLEVVQSLERIALELSMLKQHIPHVVIDSSGLTVEEVNNMPHMVDTVVAMIESMKTPMIYKYGKLMMEHSHIMERRPVINDEKP